MFKNKIIFRYIISEMLSPFALGLLIFTFILLMNKILKLMDMVINKGVGFGEVSSLILFLLPSLLVLTIPMSILLAILITLGKFSADSEIIAMKASGISLYQLLPPFAVFCILGFVVTNILTLYLLPKGNSSFKTHLIELAKKHSAAALEEGIFNDVLDGVVIYINKYKRREKRINGILVSDRRDPQLPTLIVAEYAEIFSDPEKTGLTFKLSQGSLHRLDRKSMSYQYALFSEYEMSLRFEESGKERKVKYREMSTSDLFKLAAERRKIKDPSSKINSEIHRRFAFPFACFVFGLLGLSLGVYWKRGGRSYGFIISIIIVFFYYVFLNIGENLSKSGIGIWMPNVILGALGIYLFRKAAAEKPLPLLGSLAGYIDPLVAQTKNWVLKKTGK